MVSKKFFLVLLALPVAILLLYFSNFSGRVADKTLVTVARVIDGDTFELANGKEVRLVGIDAPEKRFYGYEEAKDKLKELVLGKNIALEKDVNNADRMGRLLRYVFAGDTFVNLEMIRQGYANAYIVLPDNKYEKELMEAEEEAKSGKIGIWKLSDFANCFIISNFHYNAKGNDNENLNDEYVALRNECDFPIDMSSWNVKDRTANTYIFPQLELASRSELSVFSGPGTDTETGLYWKSEFPIWDNSGDTLYLRDSKGNLVLTNSY
ncbi:MAG TPA: thermonuclease family protein [archaeon]|nr:thermonuclease family protein [archaeon]